MIKTTLLATSAVVLGSSIGYAELERAPHQRPSLPEGAVVVISKHGVPITIALPDGAKKQTVQTYPDASPADLRPTTFSNLSRDRNAQFLSWYGYEVSGYSFHSRSASNYYFSAAGTREAIPIVGVGNRVTTIRVPTVGGGFKVAIYTNSSGNTPGRPIVSAAASGTGQLGDCCTQLVTVSIPKTRLHLGTKYWIVEQGLNNDHYGRTGTWLAEDTDFTGDSKTLTQTFTYHSWHSTGGRSSTRHYTSPWEGVTSFTEPAAEVK